MSTDPGTLGGPFDGEIGLNRRFQDAWKELGVSRLGWECPDEELQPLRSVLVQLHLGFFDKPDAEGLQDCKDLLTAIEIKWIIFESRDKAEELKARLNRIISAAEIAQQTAAVGDRVTEKLK